MTPRETTDQLDRAAAQDRDEPLRPSPENGMFSFVAVSQNRVRDLQTTIIEGLEEFTEALEHGDLVDMTVPRFSDQIFGLPEDRLRILAESREASRLANRFRITQWKLRR